MSLPLPLRQSCGIDVAKDELVCTLGRLTAHLDQELYARHTFPNSASGFQSLLGFVGRNSDTTVAVTFTMEATGAYHEELAYWLHDQGQTLAIVLPSKIAAYVRTLELKTITDATAADALCRFALERGVEPWQAPQPVYRRLRRLCRERAQIVAERTAAKNELHALQHSHEPLKSSLKRLQRRIALLDQQEAEVRAELGALAQADAEVKAALTLLCTICGVGEVTALTVLAETAGFSGVRNRRQLTSYAGLDVRDKQSGTSVRGKARISKRGNKHLRAALHFPALAAVRHDERFKGVYARIVARHGIKLKALVAVQRRLLELMDTVFKTKTPYDKTYLQKNKAVIKDRPAQADSYAAA